MYSTFRDLIERRQLASFVGLTFAISWGGWTLGSLFPPRSTPWMAFGIVGTYGPALAAVALTWLLTGSLRALRVQVFRWRVGAHWYLIVLALPLVLLGVGTAIYVALGGQLQATEYPWAAYPVVFVNILLLGGGQEEPGWRGFALPRLQRRYGALGASLVLGVIWALWHVPSFFIEGTSQAGIPFVVYAPYVVLLTVVFTWVYNSTGGSVLLTMLFHAGLNAVVVWFPADLAGGVSLANLVVVLVVGLTALALVARFGARDLSNGPRWTVGADGQPRLAADAD